MNLAPLTSASPLIQAHAQGDLAAIGGALRSSQCRKAFCRTAHWGYFPTALTVALAGLFTLSPGRIMHGVVFN